MSSRIRFIGRSANYAAVVTVCVFLGWSGGRLLNGNAITTVSGLTGEVPLLRRIAQPKGNQLLTTDKLSGIELTSHHGTVFSLDQLQGSLVVLNFLAPGCQYICPETTSKLRELQNGLDDAVHSNLSTEIKDVVFVSVSTSPKTIGIKDLQKFVSNTELDHKNWYFTQTSSRNTDSLLNAFGFVAGATATNSKQQPLIYLLDGNGVLVQRYVSNPLDVLRLTNEIDFLRRQS